jgi:hypothetical protein
MPIRFGRPAVEGWSWSGDQRTAREIMLCAEVFSVQFSVFSQEAEIEEKNLKH